MPRPTREDDEMIVSLAPLKLRDALFGLLSVPNPDATKPKHKKERRKGRSE